MTDADGVERAIPCDKSKIGGVVHQMVEKRREYYLGAGDIMRFRVWSALVPGCMQGLSHSDVAPLPATVTEFLAAYRYASPRDEENIGSGLVPLTVACISGNVEVVRELIRSHGANVNARVQVDDLNAEFGVERGNDALGIGAFSCPHAQAHEIVSVLLESGADPNSRTYGIGGTPLMAAVVGHSLEAVRALLACERLDLEIGLKVNNATALNIAGVKGTYDIVEALLRAGADRFHRYAKWLR